MSFHRLTASGISRGVLLSVTAMMIIIVAALSLASCGGGSSPTPLASTSAWKQTNATYIGEARCADCHATIEAQYKATRKGLNPTTPHTGATCQNCHVTGPEQFQFAADGTLTGTIPANMVGIGCEDCHGPGSKHLTAGNNAERKANITRTPPAKQTCIACHGSRPYNNLNQPEVLVNADFADLKNASPTSIRGPHHAAAAFVEGRYGYNIAQAMPSPHATLPNVCLDCHTPPVDPTTGMIFHGRYDANTTAWSKPNLDTSRSQCASCHSGSRDTFLQNGVTAELITIGGASATDPTTFDTSGKGGMLAAYYTAEGIAAIWAKDPTTRTTDETTKLNNYKGAMWDYKYVASSDPSLGVHNPGFTKKLLDDAQSLLQ